MKKALVFGGTGFIGLAVCRELINKGYEVTVFDMADLQQKIEGINFINGDILDKKLVEKIVKNKDYVYNFAGISELDIASDIPYETIQTNVNGCLNILEACKKNNIIRYIFASSIYVYSEKGSFYRCSKQMCELMIEEYQKKFNLDYTILRYGSVYGRSAQKNNWIREIIEQALTQKKIIRYGDGEEIREYIHVDDAAKASVDILNDKFINENVILTGANSIKIKDLLNMIREMLNNEIEIEYRKGTYEDHYEITPYTFKPKLGKKYLINPHIDLGQGILDLLYNEM